VLSGTAGVAAIAMLGGAKIETASAHNAPAQPGPLFPSRSPRLGFTAVAKNLDDAVTLPKGYSYDVLYALGDPISRTVSDYNNDGTDPAESFAFRAGDHHDGIHYFGLDKHGRHDRFSSDRGLLCMNHEAITPFYLHPTGPTKCCGSSTRTA
jgi:uncharacterized protein